MRDKQQVAQHFSRAASSYDQAATVQHYASDKLVQLLNQHQLQGHCLDLGCGTGFAFEQILNSGIEQITAVDLSEQMLEVCQQKIDQLKLNEQIQLQLADAENLPFADNSFDCIFSNLMVQWSEQPAALWAELKRVLKPNGKLIFTTLATNTMHELKTAWQQVDPFVHVNNFLTAGELEQSLIHSFEVISLEQQDYVQQFDTVTQLLKNLKAIGANNVNSGRQQGLGGREKIRLLEQHYPKNTQGVPLTYDLIWAAAAPKPL